MFFKIICIIALLEFSISKEYDAVYLPMNKDSKYGDDVCSYTNNKNIYVKPCGKGKFCDRLSIIGTLDYSRGSRIDDNSNLEICQDLPNITAFYTYKGRCSNDFECGEGYECIGNECIYKCPNEDTFYVSYEGYTDSICRPNSEKGNSGICYEETRKKDAPIEIKYSSPQPNKICGKLTLQDDPRDEKKGIYYVNKREYVYKGEVEDGEYVTKSELCKSGFALYFYKGGKSQDPKDINVVGSSDNNVMHLMCVTPISIINENSKCSINYKINENGEILRYNVRQLDTSRALISQYCTSDDKLYVNLKYQKYREFYTKITEEERETCGDLDVTNKYTCQNNELIKTWYYYKNPQHYVIYNDRKKIGKVIDYYIQKAYPCYSLSRFLSIKFIYLLLILLF